MAFVACPRPEDLLVLAVHRTIAALLLALVPMAVSASINQLHARMGGSPLGWHHLCVSFALLLMASLAGAR